MNEKVESFMEGLGERLNNVPNESVQMTLSSDMAHNLHSYLVEKKAEETVKKYRNPTAKEIADELHKYAESEDHQHPDKHTLVWAEYWLRYAIHNCNDPLHQL